MIQQDKDLLLRDLSARLPYGVKCQTKNGIGTLISVEYSFGENLVYVDFGRSEAEEYDLNDGDTVKPYLRPMSSMTEEEKEEMAKMSTLINSITLVKELGDWLNAHYLDYRGLIPMGLALEAPEDMYKTD